MSDLESCPFCGGEAEHIERHNPLSKWRHSIDCKVCGMSGSVEATKAEAIAAWNTRADTAKDAEIARLREAGRVLAEAAASAIYGLPEMLKQNALSDDEGMVAEIELALATFRQALGASQIDTSGFADCGDDAP